MPYGPNHAWPLLGLFRFFCKRKQQNFFVNFYISVYSNVVFSLLRACHVVWSDSACRMAIHVGAGACNRSVAKCIKALLLKKKTLVRFPFGSDLRHQEIVIHRFPFSVSKSDSVKGSTMCDKQVAA